LAVLSGHKLVHSYHTRVGVGAGQGGIVDARTVALRAHVSGDNAPGATGGQGAAEVGHGEVDI